MILGICSNSIAINSWNYPRVVQGHTRNADKATLNKTWQRYGQPTDASDTVTKHKNLNGNLKAQRFRKH
jgi:hypothetical protein